MPVDELVRAWQDEDARLEFGDLAHPSGNIDDELEQVLLFQTIASPSITCTGLPINCTRVASGSLCCC